MTKRNVVWRIFWRCILEFGPPAVAGAAWALWTSNRSISAAVTNFSAAFIAVGIVWASFLRIQHQQKTLASQEEASNQIDTVLGNLARVETSVQKLTDVVATQTSLSPEQSRKVETAVNEANSAVATANNAVQSLGLSVGKAFFRGALGGILKDSAKRDDVILRNVKDELQKAAGPDVIVRASALFDNPDLAAAIQAIHERNPHAVHFFSAENKPDILDRLKG